MIEPKVLLMAIAKDEAAYLPEWIFHHLNLGVAGILIYVNSTTDNTCTILDKIGQHHNVTYDVIDNKILNDQDDLIENEFLKRNPLQSRAYAHSYAICDQEKYSHVLFLDVDEFLICPRNDIRSLTDELDNFNVTLFNWFNCTGDRKDFARLNTCTRGEKSHYTKYIVKTGLDSLRFYSTHIAKDGEDLQRIAYTSSIDLRAISYLGDIWSDKAYILHRHLRSQNEYIALLGRSDTFNNTITGLKKNRRGWSYCYSNCVELPGELVDNYSKRYEMFLRSTGIVSEYSIAKESVLKRVKEVAEKIDQIRELNHQLDEMLFGTGLKHHAYTFLTLLKAHLKKPIKKKQVNKHL